MRVFCSIYYFEVEIVGLTGKVKFDQFGLRTDFSDGNRGAEEERTTKGE